MAKVYATLEDGDGRTYYNIVNQPGPFIAKNDTAIDVPRETYAEADAAVAISCSDWLDRDTPEEFAAYADRLEAESRWVGGVSTFQRLACAGWPKKQKWRITNSLSPI